MMKLTFLLIVVCLVCCKPNPGEQSSIEINDVLEVIEDTVVAAPIVIPKKEVRAGWVEIVDDEYTIVDLRYATENNFVEEQMYDCGRCFIREETNTALSEIRAVLKDKGYGIILYDCYRPRPVQQKLWDKVPNASYVTPPSRGSMHNRGVALDIGLINAEKEILDMGTEFDYFGREGHHDYYDHPKEVLDNRKLLKSTMEQHSFASIRTEWWHYSYVIGEYEIADWLWDCQ